MVPFDGACSRVSRLLINNDRTEYRYCARYLLVKETRKIAMRMSRHSVGRRLRRNVKGDSGGARKSSLVRKRVRDKIVSNELSGPDVSLMRTAEIISGRDRNTRAHATPSTIHAASLFSRNLEGRTPLPVTGGLVTCHLFVSSRRSREGYGRLCFCTNDTCEPSFI